MLTKEMLDARQAVEREEKELAELVKMYDAAESYEEFQLNRDINGLHDSNKILGVIDPFKVIYFLENHPRFSITKASCYMSAVVIILEAVLLFHRPEGWLATVSFFSAIAFNLLAFFIPDWLLHHKLASICRQSKTIYSDNIP